METATTASTTAAAMINVFNDKPDELVSSAVVQSHNHPQHSQPQSTNQPKKCLHHRLYQGTIAGSNMPDQITALLLQRQLQQHQQQQQSQQRLLLGNASGVITSAVLGGGNGANGSNALIAGAITTNGVSDNSGGATSVAAPAVTSVTPSANHHSTNQNNNNNNNNNSNSGSSGSNSSNSSNSSNVNTNNLHHNNISIIPNQNGLVQQMNAALLAERYLLLDLVDGSTLYKCVDVKTREELVCKVSIFHTFSLFSEHLRNQHDR